MAIEDGAIWLGIGRQLIFADIDITNWKPHYSTPGRIYLTSCILDKICPSAASLRVLSASSESIEHTSIGGHQGIPVEIVAVQGIPYNMLHPGYNNSPILDSCPPVSLGKSNISTRSLTTAESVYFQNLLQGGHLTSIYYNGMLKG